MADEQFTVEDQPRSSDGGCTTILIGCLITSLVLVAVACGLGYYIYLNFGVWAAGMLEDRLVVAVETSQLPPEQKEGMKEQVSRVAKAYRDGEIDTEQVVRIVENLMQSPAFTAIPVEIARSQYIVPSGLSDEEKADGVQQLQRVAHGAFEKLISEDELKDVMDGHIADVQADGNLQFRSEVSDDELREFITACKELADSKEIPDQSYEIDFAAELKQAVDAVIPGASGEVEVDAEAPLEIDPVEARPQELEAVDQGND